MQVCSLTYYVFETNSAQGFLWGKFFLDYKKGRNIDAYYLWIDAAIMHSIQIWIIYPLSLGTTLWRSRKGFLIDI